MSINCLNKEKERKDYYYKDIILKNIYIIYIIK